MLLPIDEFTKTPHEKAPPPRRAPRPRSRAVIEQWYVQAENGIDALLRWTDTADRKVPVPADVLARANTVLRLARRLLAPFGVDLRLTLMPPLGRAMPGDVFVGALYAGHHLAELGDRILNVCWTGHALWRPQAGQRGDGRGHARLRTI
jgi:hypothetical protein